MFGTARIKIGSGKHLHLKIYPSRTLFLGTRTIFIRAVPKILCSVNGPLRFVPMSVSTDLKFNGSIHYTTKYVSVLFAAATSAVESCRRGRSRFTADQHLGVIGTRT